MEETAQLYGRCPYLTVQNLLSGKWTLLILCYLQRGPLRFGELRRCLANVSDVTQATLTKALRKLEEEGLVVRHVYAEVPPHVEYSLSDLGKELSPILKDLAGFGVRYIESRTGRDNICDEAYTSTCLCYIQNDSEKSGTPAPTVEESGSNSD